MPIEVAVKTDKRGRRHIIGRLRPGHSLPLDNYSLLGAKRRNKWLVFTRLPSHRGPRTSLAGRHK